MSSHPSRLPGNLNRSGQKPPGCTTHCQPQLHRGIQNCSHSQHGFQKAPFHPEASKVFLHSLALTGRPLLPTHIQPYSLSARAQLGITATAPGGPQVHPRDHCLVIPPWGHCDVAHAILLFFRTRESRDSPVNTGRELIESLLAGRLIGYRCKLVPRTGMLIRAKTSKKARRWRERLIHQSLRSQ